jgi:hypothetical protein
MKTGQALLFILVAALVWGCGRANTATARAHILERKAVKNGKLLVHYVFAAGERLVADSLELGAETIVPHDSVPVEFSQNDPRQHQLKLP